MSNRPSARVKHLEAHGACVQALARFGQGERHEGVRGGERRAGSEISAPRSSSAAARLQSPQTYDFEGGGQVRRNPRFTEEAPMPFVLALDQGTTSSRAILFDHRGQACGVAQQEFPQIFPQPGLGRARPEGDLGDRSRRWPPRRCAERGHRRRRHRRDRHHQPARDDGALGPRHRRSRCATPSSGRTGARRPCATDCRPAGQRRLFAAKTGLVLDAYFSATKLEWLLDHVPGAARGPKRGELAFGTVDSWLIWKLTGGSVHVDRRVERQPHPALQHPPRRLGRRAAARFSTCRVRCCREVGPSSESATATRPSSGVGRASRSPASPATSRPPSSARPASRRAWPRTPTAPAASC